MAHHDDLAHTFDEHRPRLRGMAYRILGSLPEAEDAVQEAWLRLPGRDGTVENLGGWLTTVVARVCLDMLRSRKSRREEPVDLFAAAATAPASDDPEEEAMLADSVGLAVLVVLDTLEPPERLAFVLHDMLGVDFDEISRILGRTPAASRQLASRARRRLRGATPARASQQRQREVVEAFLRALRAGDFQGLVAVLHPDVVVHIDAASAGGGQARVLRGAENWARGAITFTRLARFNSVMLVDGAPGLVFAPNGRVERALTFSLTDGLISDVEIIADRERLDKLEVALIGQ